MMQEAKIPVEQSTTHKGLYKLLLINWAISILISLFFLTKNALGVGGHLLMTHPEIVAYLQAALKQTAVWKEVIQFLASLLLLHLGWAALCTWILSSLQYDVHNKWKRRLLIHGGFLIMTLWLLMLNSLFYPYSLTAVFKDTFLARPEVVVATGMLLSFLLIHASLQHARLHPRRMASTALLGLALVLSMGFTTQHHTTATQKHNETTLPNVIIIGIDALRPDHLGINGFTPSVTPFLDHMLDSSLIFDDTYTPLARTYGAWVSILSGRYPVHHGARFNLMPPNLVDRDQTLPHVLKGAGYHTVYAIDERRFNNIDETYGFDQIVGPKAGAADFLLTPFVDDPLLNLISPSPIARILFPFVYDNRAHHKIYDPFLFVRDVVRAAARSEGNPLFLSVHFTLPHWPFVNNAMPGVPGHFDKFDEDNPTYYFYLSMLRQADAQLEDLMNGLEHEGILDNAIVFFISDHGECFMLDDDGPLPAIPQAHFITNESGHGTNVLTNKQYRVLLAYRRYGASSPKGRSERPSSLIDIAPTIHALLGLDDADIPYDGSSLFHEEDAGRPRFIESSINPASISKKRLDAVQAVAEGVAFYTVDDNGRMIVRPELIDSVVSAKQRAVIVNEWMLAMFPDMDEDLAVVDLKRNLWWPSRFAPEPDRVANMLNLLCNFYQNDTGFDPNGFCRSNIHTKRTGNTGIEKRHKG